jgi:hypothetical protein
VCSSILAQATPRHDYAAETGAAGKVTEEKGAIVMSRCCRDPKTKHIRRCKRAAACFVAAILDRNTGDHNIAGQSNIEIPDAPL